MADVPYPRPLDAGVARIVSWLDADRREAFDERAGIMEYEAKMPRLEAERLALIQTLSHYGLPPVAQLLRSRWGNDVHWVLATDAVAARRALETCGATDVMEAPLDGVLPTLFGGLALLSPWPDEHRGSNPARNPGDGPAPSD